MFDELTYPALKTSAYSWQEFEVERHYDDVVRALLLDMRLGKTRIVLESALRLYWDREIDGLLVLAPGGVHANWVNREIPAHVPDEIELATFTWRASTAGTKREQARFKEFLAAPCLAILAMSYDAAITPKGRAALKRFLEKRRCLAVLDESHMVKTPKVARTLVARAVGKRAEYRRILTGTVAPNAPWDVYSQYLFLDEDFWKHHGIRTYAAFKARFGDWKMVARKDGRCARCRKKQCKCRSKLFPMLLRLKDVGKLWEMIEPVSTRLRLEDVGEAVPETHQVVEFELPAPWRRHYHELVETFRTELDNGEIVTAAHVLSRITRLQQVACGHLPGGPLAGPNPRARLAVDLVEGAPGQSLIWCRFRPDVTAVLMELKKRRITAVRYDGAVGDTERTDALAAFGDGSARVFVGNPAAGGRGLTLPCATVINYSTSYNLEHRLQSIARARIVGGAGLHIVDIVAERTADRKTLERLEQKWNVAAQATGDDLRDLLAESG